MVTFGKSKEHHFDKLVDVLIEGYYKVGGRNKLPDAPNIDDKIFTDILNRHKLSVVGRTADKKRVMKLIDRPVWFIEDDNPKFLRQVIKRAIPSDHYKVVITITEVEV